MDVDAERSGDLDALAGEGAPRALAGRQGAYALLGSLGHGGMGDVYLAEQRAPLQRRVAVKLLREGIAGEQGKVRFEIEVQALARMDHPAVARIFDSGVTAGGRPFLVMELVDGVPIGRYCDDRRLDVEARLELFVRVCDGVAHAHQRGVLHRDLKPTNILVQATERGPEPKLIDFGLAKALGERVFDRSAETTRLGNMVGTPAYMSPEQITPDLTPVDTRSDVHALGVVLYGLLTGSFPFPLEGREVLAQIQLVRVAEPIAPSVRLASRDPAEAEEEAARRGTTPARLARRLREDLDGILLKALEKNPDRRYPGPAELAEDLRRHLRQEPVLAKSPTGWYRLRKLVRRHRAAVLVATSLVVALLAGLAGTGAGLVEARRANRALAAARDAAHDEAARSDAIRRFLADMLSSPAGDRGGAAARIVDVLDRAAEQATVALAGEPEVRGEVARTLGAVYRDLGLYARASAYLEVERESALERLGPDHDVSLALTAELARSRDQERRHEEAQALHREVLHGLRRKLGAGHPETLEAIVSLATAYAEQGRDDVALKLLDVALAGQRAVFGADDPRTLETLYRVGHAYHVTLRLAEAEAALRDELARRARLEAGYTPARYRAENLFALVLQSRGLHTEAEAVLRGALAHVEPLADAESGERTWSDRRERLLTNLGVELWLQGRLEEAAASIERLLALGRPALGDEHPRMLQATKNLARVHRFLGRPGEAVAALRGVVAVRRRTMGDDHPWTTETRLDLADALASAGDLTAARAELSAIAPRIEPLAADLGLYWARPYFDAVRGHLLVREGRRDEGLRLLTEARRRLAAEGGEHEFYTVLVDRIRAELAGTG